MKMRDGKVIMRGVNHIITDDAVFLLVAFVCLPLIKHASA